MNDDETKISDLSGELEEASQPQQEPYLDDIPGFDIGDPNIGAGVGTVQDPAPEKVRPRPIRRVGEPEGPGGISVPVDISPSSRLALQKHIDGILRDYSHIAIGMDRCLDRGSRTATQSLLAKNAIHAARSSAATLIITTVIDVIAADIDQEESR
jgi:hypothetical protein